MVPSFAVSSGCGRSKAQLQGSLQGECTLSGCSHRIAQTILGGIVVHIQKAENGVLDPSWLELAFCPKTLIKKNRGVPKTPNSTTTDPTPHSRPPDTLLSFFSVQLLSSWKRTTENEQGGLNTEIPHDSRKRAEYCFESTVSEKRTH